MWPVRFVMDVLHLSCVFNKVFWKCRDFLGVTCSFILKGCFLHCQGRVLVGGWLVLLFRTLNLTVLWLLLHRAAQHPCPFTVRWTAQYLSCLVGSKGLVLIQRLVCICSRWGVPPICVGYSSSPLVLTDLIWRVPRPASFPTPSPGCTAGCGVIPLSASLSLTSGSPAEQQKSSDVLDLHDLLPSSYRPPLDPFQEKYWFS